MAGRRKRIEFGDFQTPAGLASQVCAQIRRRGIQPASLVEPTCGEGQLLQAALEAFPEAREAVGLDINPGHVEAAMARLPAHRVRLAQGDFFHTDWPGLLGGLPEPLLVIGNPPWTTSAGMSRVAGKNLPPKKNVERRRGIEAITGKSNFDISQWMIAHLLQALSGRHAVLAMLCKTAVARKVLQQAWMDGHGPARAGMYLIDAREAFGAAVDACLLLCELSPHTHQQECGLHPKIPSRRAARRFGLQGGVLVADLKGFARSKQYLHSGGHQGSAPRWRSGIKHDCARVMELKREGDGYVNGLGERVRLEQTFLFPLLKSSDLARGTTGCTDRWMLVPQQAVNHDTAVIARQAPRTWQYLQRHTDLLDARASKVYQGRPRFSVFGVGEYAFAPWKVAVSGLYKAFCFRVVGPLEGKPVVLDDTAYFLPCESEAAACGLAALLDSAEARELFNSLVFWDAKRPITATLLGRLDLDALQQFHE